MVAGFSTRAGGVSAVYGETGADMNVGFTPEDSPLAVEENRRRLVAEAGGSPWQLVVVQQVHGTAIREVSAANVGEAMEGGRGRWLADGLVTGEPGLLLGVGVADCVPVLIADVAQHVVGGFHAGWRGTAAGMAEYGVAAMAARFGTRAEDCVAAIGPSIGSCCYEVDRAVLEGFQGEAAAADCGAVFQPSRAQGRWQLDLWAANRLQLQRAGLPGAAITVLGECTACTREIEGDRRYFSHRAEGGRTGRMLGVIGVRADAPVR